MQALNPLDRPGDVFDLELSNPNPTSSKTKDGPVYRVSFEVTRDTWDWFMETDTKGMLVAAKACVVDLGEEAQALEPAKEKGPFGSMSKVLRTLNVHMAYGVREALGGDEAFLAWLRTQPCAMRARWQGNDQHGGQVVAAHVRRIGAGAGMGIKPKYSAIALCDACHQIQHTRGESALGGKEYLTKAADTALGDWAWSALRDAQGVESMTQANPAMVYEWFARRDLQHLLPEKYRAMARAE